jgi:predicted amidohydrolase YtcJ
MDLQGRTVIPGLIDSHLHGIRAALSFSTEVNWIGASSLDDALGRITQASRTMKTGAWLIVAGGWNVQQLKEKRLPTQAELTAAAPDNPVYVQLGYGWALMTPAGYKAMGISNEGDLPPGGRFEKGSDGKATGAITGSQGAIVALFDRLPLPSAEQQVDGTQKFFRELNRLGITGFVDPGGNNLSPEDYPAVFKVWRDGKMTARVAFALNGQTSGKELEEYQNLTRLVPMGLGDEMLKFNGIGERITFDYEQ